MIGILTTRFIHPFALTLLSIVSGIYSSIKIRNEDKGEVSIGCTEDALTCLRASSVIAEGRHAGVEKRGKWPAEAMRRYAGRVRKETRREQTTLVARSGWSSLTAGFKGRAVLEFA